MTQDDKAPEIPRLAYVRRLGSGGYSDVFLYRQSVPAREVAVKVLRVSEDTPPDLDAFRAEADAMARLSHPSIVPIYAADVADDGRPYIVMAYMAQPNLAVRSKKAPLPVEEVLTIGVKIAAALETAHRSGILHRDVKPHNVLVNNYGAPILADFGIASDQAGNHPPASALSLPWASPETLGENPHADERSDIYSLAATLYTLMLGRSPFERKTSGADNGLDAIQHRILNDRPGPIRLAGIPNSLRQLLLAALSRDPAKRPASALTFAEGLADVQSELGLAVTPIELPQPAPTAPIDVSTPSSSPEESTLDRRLLPPVARTTAVSMPSAPAWKHTSPARRQSSARPWRVGVVAGAMLALLGFGAALAAVAVSNTTSTARESVKPSPSPSEQLPKPELEPSPTATTPSPTPVPIPAPVRPAPVQPRQMDEDDLEDYLEDYCEDNEDDDRCDGFDDDSDDDSDDDYDSDDDDSDDDDDDDSDDDEDDDDSDDDEDDDDD